MKNNFKKIQNLTVFLIAILFFAFGNAQISSAQTSTNFGTVTDYPNKQVIENPANVVGDPSQISSSSCPDGSVLVGFNLYNQGENFSKLGSLYCRSVEINFGGASIYTKLLIENPFNGGANSTQINSSSCPNGFVATGFNVLNAGANASSEGVLYCKQVLSAKVSPTGQSQSVSVGSQNTIRKDVIQNPFGSGGNSTQIAASSCPDGYVVTGFNLINMGENFSGFGDLYCSNLTFTPNPLEFDFSLSNNGHKYIKAGDTVSNTLFTNAIVSNVTGDVKLTIDSIKNSNGVSVMNVTNGFTVSSNPFSPKTNIVTLSPTIKQVTTPLSFVANNSVLPDTYTVNVSGVYTKTVAGTSGSTTNYYCKIEFKSDNSRYYFGCNSTSDFSPKDDFIATGNSSTPSAIQCINSDDFGPGGDAICFDNNKVLSIFAKEQIRNFRMSFGDSVCPGTVTVPDDPNNNFDGPNNPGTGFTCKVDSVAPVTQTINKTTTFDVVVQPPVVNIDYALSVTPSADGCPASSLFVTATWKAIPNASSYNLYRNGGFTNQIPTATISVNNPPVNGYVNYTDSIFGDYNVLVQYYVTAVVNGVEIKKSDYAWVFTPQLTPNCIPPVTPVVKLFTKKTTDTVTNLSTMDANTAITTANTEISISKNEAFDLKWVSNLGPNYTCTQVTVLPNGTTNNTRIVYGNSTNGTSIGIAGSNLDTGTNLLKVSCSNGVAVLSNVVRITVLFEPIYNFSVIPSGDQCLASDVWIKQTWTAVPGASSYKIARTGGSGPVNYTIASPNLINNEDHNAFNSTTATAYTYTITAVMGGVDQIPSAPITIMSPKVDCPPESLIIKLFTRKSTDSTVNFSTYTTATALIPQNSDIVVTKGQEYFDLKWMSSLDNSYVCTQVTTTPTGTTNNALWSYGTYPNGTVYWQGTGSVATGVYGFKVSCTKGVSTVESNTVNVNIVNPISYNFIVAPSANQCDINNLQIRLTWSLIPGATSYRITRTEVGTGLTNNYAVSSGTFTQSFANGTIAFVQGVDYTYKVVAMANGVAIAPSSPTVTVKSPKQDAALCSTLSLKLEVKKSTESNTLYRSAITINKGENFDIRWTIVNPNGSVYMNSNSVIGPQGINGNGLWTWGSGSSSSRTGLSSTPQAVIAGDYIFKIDMMDTSTGNYVLALSSNSAKVTIINTTTDVCPNLPGIQTVVPDGMIKNSAGDCVFDSNNPPQPDLNIKLFIAENDTDVISYNSLSTPDHSLANKRRGETFGISWVTNLPSGYECEPQTEDSGRNSINNFPWNRSGNRVGNDLNGYSIGLQTNISNPDNYNFYLLCVDTNNSNLKPRIGNVVQMALSDIAVDPNSIRLFIGGANILSSTLTTPINPNPTFKVKKGNRFNLLWASNLNNSYECTASTKKSDGIEFTTWDWNTNKSKGDKTTNLTTGNVEKGIYSFQLFCTDPAHDPGNPDKQSNIVKLQVVESTIIEQ